MFGGLLFHFGHAKDHQSNDSTQSKMSKNVKGYIGGLTTIADTIHSNVVNLKGMVDSIGEHMDSYNHISPEGSVRNIESAKKERLRVEPTDQKGTRYEIEDHKEFKSSFLNKAFRNPGNYIYVRSSKEIIYFDKYEKKWFLHKYDQVNYSHIRSGTRIPISKCVSTVYGGAGYISPVIEVTVGASFSLSGTVDLTDAMALDGGMFSATKGLKLSGSVKYSGRVTCSLEEGQYCQPYIQPYYIVAPPGRRIEVRYSQRKGIVTRGEWTPTKSFKRIVSISPVVECSVGPNYSVCASDVIPGVSVEQFENFLAEHDYLK